MQMNITGFLRSKYARMFIQELWELLISAQENIGGIPTKLVEQKQEEIKLKKVVFAMSAALLSNMCVAVTC